MEMAYSEETPTQLIAYVIGNPHENILEWPWIGKLGLWDHLGQVSKINGNSKFKGSVSLDGKDKFLINLQNKFSAVFKTGLGKCNKFKAHLQLKCKAQPVFCGKRPVPIDMKTVVDNRLVDIGVVVTSRLYRLGSTHRLRQKRRMTKRVWAQTMR